MDGEAPRGPPGQPEVVDISHLPPGTQVVVQQQQQQGLHRQHVPKTPFDQIWAGALVLFLVPFISWFMFMLGVSAIDDPNPDADMAVALHSFVIFLGFASVAWTIVAGPKEIWKPMLYGLVGGLFTYVWAQDSLREWDGGGTFMLMILGIFGLVGMAAMGGLWGWRIPHGDSSDFAGAMALGWSFPLALVSIEAVTTAEARAVEAAQYYQETPGLGLVFLLVGLLALAWLRRR